jgi:ABC-2 type transport system permease protein
MSTSAPAINLPRASAGGRVTQARVFLSEWTKLRSLRSTLYTLGATAVLTMGISIVIAAINSSNWNSMSAISKASFDPLHTGLAGVQFGVLPIGVLGVLMITGEYTTGMIRSTFAAVPTRLPVLWAKVGVYALVALAVAGASTLVGFFASQAILSSHHIQISFSHSGVPRAVLGSALYLTLAGLFGLGLGGVLRSTAAGIATFAGTMFVLPPLVQLLPTSTAQAIDPYLPSNAGGAIMQIGHPAHTLSPWVGLAVFAGYTALAIAAAAVRLVKRDV